MPRRPVEVSLSYQHITTNIGRGVEQPCWAPLPKALCSGLKISTYLLLQSDSCKCVAPLTPGRFRSSQVNHGARVKQYCWLTFRLTVVHHDWPRPSHQTSLCVFVCFPCPVLAMLIFNQIAGSYRGSYFSTTGLLTPEMAKWSWYRCRLVSQACLSSWSPFWAALGCRCRLVS